ncbi:hypothetical protein [Pedobacter sp. SYP-B3415]|uniref:hypothetical protein n=1 Tax=Pedobacter sp. SYP-B3415 TaxID=2496641 RepID=UPI00101D1197|nr:hypothetical protein [Pedobacter sp. SYP-B3415]
MRISCLCILLLSFLIGCSGKKTLWKGTCGDQPCELTLVNEPGAASAYTFTQLQIGELPPVAVNAQTTDPNGMPYSDDLFSGSETRFAKYRPGYQNAIFNSSASRATMLYMDPARYSMPVFEQYSRFFLSQWESVRKNVTDQSLELPLIGGTVRASRTDFIRVFHGLLSGSDHFFMVTPDGTITLLEGKTPEKATGVPRPSTLAAKIEMPGRIIRIRDSARFSPAMLRSFRDDHDKSLEDYFQLVYAR